jgi:hypothetical protein
MVRGMSKGRLDKWRKVRSTPAFITPGDDEVMEIAKRRWKERKARNEAEDFSESDIYQGSKELIFDISDGRPVFHAIMYRLNTKTFRLEIMHLVDILTKGEDPAEIKEEVKHTLALALIHDVPVYPNTEELGPELARYYRDVLVEGFRAPDESGEYVRLKLVDSPSTNLETLDHLKRIKISEAHSPAELHWIRDAALAEITKRDEAGRVLDYLRLAIGELSGLLERTTRNENDLQECLTHNPILFGTEYRRIIPKHKLGAEYEMDYALEHVTGLIDLVEIEASTHRLFTKKGDPRQPLIHAEQQVLDWLGWIERHGMYARENLPGLARPAGYVVIGRSWDLSKGDRERLQRRNAIFRGAIQVLTYDDCWSVRETFVRCCRASRQADPASLSFFVSSTSERPRMNLPSL